MKINFKTYLSYIFLSAVMLFNTDNVYSQDGEKLFKSNCSSCHHPLKNATGPKLQGALEKWNTAEEGDLIYEWVKNPTSLYKSGRSKMAKKIWEFSPSAMSGVPNLSNEEIDAIFSYVDDYKAPVASDEELTVSSKDVKEENNTNYWLMLVIVVLLIVVISVAKARKTLSNVIKEREGEIVPSEVSFLNMTREWMTKNWAITIMLAVIVALSFGAEGMTRLMQVGVFKDYQPSQPIAFSHQLHAGKMQIECKNCHHSANKSKHAGIPSANVCMVCHTLVKEGTTTGTSEISKITDAIDNNEPIVWNKAHNLPDHVFFSHSQHVHKNTGAIDCRQCHGEVETFTTGRISSSEEINAYAKTDEGKEKGIVQLTKPILTMGWCIECHNKKEIDLTTSGYYQEMHNRLKNDTNFMNNIFKDDKVTVKELGGWECGKCHY